MRFVWLCLSFVALCSCGTLAAHGQDLPDVAQGLQPYSPYHGGGLDKVNLGNNSLTVRIPLVSYPQKGSLELSYSVVFNSFGFMDVGQCASTPGGPDDGIVLHEDCQDAMTFAPVGLSNNVVPSPTLVLDQALLGAGGSGPEPMQSVLPNIDTRLYVIASDNSQHALGATSDGYRSLDDSDYLFIPASPVRGAVNASPAVNASSADPTLPTMTTVNGTVIDSAGRKYTASSITDPDGNQIQMTQSGTLDSAGRSIPGTFTADTVGAGATSGCPILAQAQFQPLYGAVAWTVPGPGGTVTYLFCYAKVNIVTHLFGMTGAPDASVRELFQAATMLQSIVLPNGTHWGFIYDSNDPNTHYGPTGQTAGLGQLMTLLYPTGGSANYTYTYPEGACDSGRRAGLANNPLSVQTTIPQVTSRTLLDASGKIVGQWNYTAQGVVSLAGDVTVELETDTFPSNSFCNTPIDAGNEVWTGLPGAGGKRLRRTVKSYWNGTVMQGYPAASIVREAGSVTTLEDGSQYTVQNTYAPAREFWATSCDGYGNNCQPGLAYSAPIGKPTSIVYRNFDGSILKQEQTTYQWQLDTGDTSYLLNNFLEIPASQTVLDANGSAVEATGFTYDETAYSPGGVRGHATSVVRSLYATAGPSPTAHTGWNSAGEKSFRVDANGNTTTYGYNPSTDCNGSLVTDTYNALNQHVSGAYDCNTGQLTSLIDANGNTTSISYEPMRRIAQVTYPSISAGTPVTQFTYDDAANTVLRTVAASPHQVQSTTVAFDSFGREVHRYSSAGGTRYQSIGSLAQTVTVDTTYDFDGRIYTVSNPYYSASDATYGLTTTSYDALNRAINVTKPDYSAIQTVYSGPTVDSIDEASKVTRHVSDALGRLTDVYEDQTGANLHTSYGYDPLGNLLGVLQSGAAGETARTRGFTYDSLSRLITSNNPETGTICYGWWNGSSCQGGYDPNGNLLYKTDANDTTISYTYDALNRLTHKYSDDGTVADDYYWDTIPSGNLWGTPFACVNGIGRLCLADHGGVGGTGFDYDAMGRVKDTLYAIIAAQPTYVPGVAVNYDLAGNPTDLTYPDLRTVHQVFDGLGRLESISDTSNGLTGSTYFAGASYSPAGELTGAGLGNGVTEGYAFNKRLQPIYAVATSAVLPPNTTSPGIGNLLDRQIFYTSSLMGVNGCNSPVANTGNVAIISDNLQTGWTHNFGFDSLNRLCSAARSDNGYRHVYNYDSFGNLLVQDQNASAATNNQWKRDPSGTNRLFRVVDSTGQSIYQYDNAGNLVSTGGPQYGGHSYNYNSLNDVYCLDNCGTAFYLYNGSDERELKLTPGSWTSYVYFGGQPMAERDNNGVWTDYIYANGQKVAKVASAKPVLHMQGMRDNSINMACGVEGYIGGLANPLNAVPIQDGDQFVVDVKDPNADMTFYLVRPNGLGMGFMDSVSGMSVQAYAPGDTQWHHIVADLSSYATSNNGGPELVQNVTGGIHADTGTGHFDVWATNMAIVHKDGSVLPLIVGSGASIPIFNGTQCGGYNLSAVTEATATTDPAIATNYYLDDHLGTTQMELSGGGWPLWQGQFTPFGQEIANGMTLQPGQPDGASTHYKFTGKERDQESGLDYFGARYYASSMGRFMSPDWDSDPRPVPYANLQDPQTLNLYEYAENNPLSRRDADGHVPCGGTASITINVNSNGTSSMSQSADDCPTMNWWDTLMWRRQVWANHWNDRIDRQQAIKMGSQPAQEDKEKALEDILDTLAGEIPAPKAASAGSMQKQVEKGQAPKSVDRVDKGRGPFEQDHIEFEGKSGKNDALNRDGTWKHNGRPLSNEEKAWVVKNGWNLPKE